MNVRMPSCLRFSGRSARFAADISEHPALIFRAGVSRGVRLNRVPGNWQHRFPGGPEGIMIERLGRNFSALEVTLRAKTIEDAAASTLQRADNSALEQPLAAPAAGSPAWTQANQGDPGVTLLELLSWVDALDAYRTARSFDNPARRAAVGAAARPVTDSDP